MRRLLLATLLVPLALSLGPDRSRAEQPPGTPGDVYWQLVPNGLLSDQRIQEALLLLVDTDGVASKSALEGSLLYGGTRDVEVIDQLEQSEAEARLLLAAAGFDDPPVQLRETRRCRIWTADAAATPDTLTTVAAALSEALSSAWAQLGVEIQPCELTADQDQADVLVWEFGQDYSIAEGAYDFQADSYLGANIERPGAIPGGTGGGDVSPPATGDAGLLGLRA
jgi:hypothetical protein